MLARRQFVGVAVGSVAVVSGGSLLADAVGAPGPRRASPWAQQTWSPVSGDTIAARDPQGRSRRLTVGEVTPGERQAGVSGASFTVSLTSRTSLVEGIYRVSTPSTGSFLAFLTTGSVISSRSATMVVNRSKPVGR